MLVCRTLLTIMANLIDKPNEAKYRRIRRQAQGFHNNLGRLDTAAVEAMSAIGFEAFTEPSGEEVCLRLCFQHLR